MKSNNGVFNCRKRRIGKSCELLFVMNLLMTWKIPNQKNLLKPRSTTTFEARKPTSWSHSLGLAFIYCSTADLKMTILSYGTSIPNLSTTFSFAWGLRAPLMMREFAIAAFDTVAHSFVALQTSVVENKVTLETTQLVLPSVLVSLFTSDIWIWSPAKTFERSVSFKRYHWWNRDSQKLIFKTYQRL